MTGLDRFIKTASLWIGIAILVVIPIALIGSFLAVGSDSETAAVPVMETVTPVETDSPDEVAEPTRTETAAKSGLLVTPDEMLGVTGSHSSSKWDSEKQSYSHPWSSQNSITYGVTNGYVNGLVFVLLGPVNDEYKLGVGRMVVLLSNIIGKDGADEIRQDVQEMMGKGTAVDDKWSNRNVTVEYGCDGSNATLLISVKPR